MIKEWNGPECKCNACNSLLISKNNFFFFFKNFNFISFILVNFVDISYIVSKVNVELKQI